ncbi:MarR family winged helix-turn-helix transcriptional regulator [Azospirillum sp. B510]|uniref:MarR family winged helix-turn-helix transcriptional regulator n=1 Tax=Azospirillum sp. (strain B510) TaxID=137722 RepID=UPI000311845E|nr:MarR family transcriptional regulator [Azospirillum sp. B510]
MSGSSSTQTSDLPQPEGFSRKRMRRDWPFYWISRVNGRYVQALEQRLKPLNLDMPRWRVLMCLYEDEHQSISEIAEFSVLKLNTATKIVQRMLADGLVATRARPTDGRATEVTLTPHGDRMRQLAMAEADGILAASFVGISAEEMAALNGLLEKVFNRLGEV